MIGSLTGKKVFHTALVIIPSNDIWEDIQEIRKEYDSHFQRWMPHITILFPFVSPEEFIIVKENLMEVLSNEIEPFEVNLNEFGYFNQKSNSTLWLKPESTQLQPLYELIKKTIPSLFKDERPEFIPHLTLGQFQKTEVKSIIKEFKKNWKSISFKCSSIELIQRDNKESPFYIKESIKLGTE